MLEVTWDRKTWKKISEVETDKKSLPNYEPLTLVFAERVIKQLENGSEAKHISGKD